MEFIRRPKMRYGEPDFDRDYLTWGFHDEETQQSEARSVLGLVKSERPLRILDLGCGPGVHAVTWASQGHYVSGIDLSATFIDEARRRADKAGVTIDLCVADVRSVAPAAPFDLITWIERPFFDLSICRRIAEWLAPGGMFVTDVRNPEHPRTKKRQGEWKSWRKEGRRYLLESHGSATEDGHIEDLWITIDCDRGTVLEEYQITDNSNKLLPLDEQKATLREAGLRQAEIWTLSGERFEGQSEPYWLWLTATR